MFLWGGIQISMALLGFVLPQQAQLVAKTHTLSLHPLPPSRSRDKPQSHKCVA